MTTDPFVSNIEELLANNADHAASFDDADLQVAPSRQLALVACMDSRLDTFKVLGLANGEAHIIRNAAGVVTDDVIRSLCLSQRLLGTREIVLVHHTDCGLQKVTDESFKADLLADIGVKPEWAIEAFVDPYDDVRQSIKRLIATPFLLYKDLIRGFVYDVSSGRLVDAG